MMWLSFSDSLSVFRFDLILFWSEIVTCLVEFLNFKA